MIIKSKVERTLHEIKVLLSGKKNEKILSTFYKQKIIKKKMVNLNQNYKKPGIIKF